MKKILTLVLMLLLMAGGLSLANHVPQARYYYDDDYYDDDRYENDYDYDDYLEDEYEREAYLRAHAQYKNRVQQASNRTQQIAHPTRPTAIPVPTVSQEIPVVQQSATSTGYQPNIDSNSGDMLSQIAATADIFESCEINGVPVSCQELINKGNQLIAQSPILKGFFGNMNGLMRFALSFVVIGGIISLVMTVFTIWMLIDLVSKQQDNKVLWLLLILFLPLVWPLLYYFLAKRPRARHNEENSVEEISIHKKEKQEKEKDKKSDSNIIDID